MIAHSGRVIALGFFDGIHLGHATLLEQAKLRAREKGLSPAVMSFDLHPDNLVAGRTVTLINSIEDRLEILIRCFGITDVVLAHFDQNMMHMPWDVFIEDYLVGQLGAKHLVCGYDFRFGDKGKGNPDLLQEKCQELGIGCDVMPKVELDGVTVSSTHVRQLLQDGDMETAMTFLGHPHCISGQVVHGREIGRTIGIPTSNLEIPRGIMVPGFGVYATKVTLPDGEEKLAVTNVGVRPTVGNSDHVTVEPWILDFSGDLYGKTIRADFYKKLRGEKKFDSLEALKEEIHRNADETITLFG